MGKTYEGQKSLFGIVVGADIGVEADIEVEIDIEVGVDIVVEVDIGVVNHIVVLVYIEVEVLCIETGVVDTAEVSHIVLDVGCIGEVVDTGVEVQLVKQLVEVEESHLQLLEIRFSQLCNLQYVSVHLDRHMSNFHDEYHQHHFPL